MLTRALNGDHYLQYDYNQYRIVCMAATYGLAFPFAAMLEDEKGRRALDRIAAVLTAVIAAGCWLAAVIAALRGEVIPVPFFGQPVRHHGGWPAVCPWASILTLPRRSALCGLCMLIYLVVSHWKPLGAGFPRPWRVRALFMALPLSDSRTGMIAFFAERGHCGGGRLPAAAHFLSNGGES